MSLPSPDRMVSAGLGKRFVAYVIDAVPMGIGLMLAGQIPALLPSMEEGTAVRIVMALWIAVMLGVFWGVPLVLKGQTLGHKVMGVWVVTATLEQAGPGKLLVRAVAKLAVLGCMPLVLASLAFGSAPLPRIEGVRDDSDTVMRFVHDMLAGTYTVVERTE